MRLPYSIKTETPDLKGFDLKYYKPARDHQEEKTRGWLNQAESPRGLLGKACPVCSYEYGSAWKKRDLPEAVIKFISELPEASERPAWV